MECGASASQSVTDFVTNQSYFVQTIIMIGFILIILLLLGLFWISLIIGEGFSNWFSDKVQEWAGLVSFSTIIFIICSLAIELNYWTSYVVPPCMLNGMISITKSVSMFFIFTLQIIYITFFVKLLVFQDDDMDYLLSSKTATSPNTRRDGAASLAFTSSYLVTPIFITCFPKVWGSSEEASKASGDFRRYGIWMIIGGVYSFCTASIHWLKFLTENLGITDLRLSIDFLGFEIQYTFILEKLTSLHSIWLGFPFVNFVVDAIVSIAIVGWFIWRFRLFPRVPWIIRKLFSSKSKLKV